MTDVFPPFHERYIVPKLHAGFFSISPATAAKILEKRNAGNRTVKVAKLAQLVGDMNSGAFVMNGESIIFGSDGALLDGQHRLVACRDSGVTIIVLVVVGIEPHARATVDQGIARTTGDALQIDGVEYGNNVAAMGRMAYAWIRSDGKTLGSLSSISRADVMELVGGDPTFADAAKFGVAHNTTGLASASIIGFCYWLLGQQYGVQVAGDYLTKVSTGEGLMLGDGALAARNRLIIEGRTTIQVRIEIILRGFVADYQGVKLTRIQLMKSFPALPARKRLAVAA